MAGALRQQATGFPAAGVLTFSADFTADLGACLPGSLILWIIAGDKNVGTVVAPADTPNVAVSDKTSGVSQVAAWGTADGGELVIAGTVAVNAGGSQVWALEITDTAARGPWRVVGLKTDVDPGSDRLTVTLDPVTALTADAIGVVAVAADSVNTAGTPAWSNSWTQRRTTSSGGGQAGQWGAVKTGLAKGSTQGTVFTRTGGTADNHSGLLLAFERRRVGDGVATLGGLGGSGTGQRRVRASGAQAVGALTAAGAGYLVLPPIDGAGLAVLGGLEAAGAGIDPPPTDLPLRTGPPTLVAGMRAGSPTLALGLRAGAPTVR